VAGARAYVCVYCHDLDRSHAINDVTKNKNNLAITYSMFGGWAPGVVVKRCVLAAVGLTSRPWVQSPVEAGKGRVDRRRVWGARALPPSPLRDGKMVNKYAAMIY